MRRARDTGTSRVVPVNNVRFLQRITTRGGRTVNRRYSYAQANARDEKRAIKALQEIRRRRHVDLEIDDDFMDDDVGFSMGDVQVYSETLQIVEPRHIPSRKWYDRQDARDKALRERMEEKVEAFSSSDDAQVYPPDIAASKMTLCFDFLEGFRRNVSYPLVRENAVESLLAVGWTPTAPIQPTIAVSSRTCADMHAAQVRNPSLGIRGYAEYKCDISGIRMSNGMYQMFRLSYEFWSLLNEAYVSRLEERLGLCMRECPACVHKLDSETAMKPSIIFAVDGNFSLKRYGAAGTRKHVSDSTGRYIAPEQVDKFEVDRNLEKYVASKSHAQCYDSHRANHSRSSEVDAFDETGWVVAVCRHGYLFKWCDIIKSGEKRKYGLALISELVEKYGGDIGIGYDIACSMSKTTRAHPLAGSKSNGVKWACGAFHAYAHNRLCQLQFNPRYIEGFGLDNLEHCERLFNITNPLAVTTRTAGAKVRHRRIEERVDLLNWDRLANLGSNILSNFRNAKKVLQTSRETLIAHPGVDDECVDGWLREEQGVLEGEAGNKASEVLVKKRIYIQYLRRKEDLEYQLDELNMRLMHGRSRDVAQQEKLCQAVVIVESKIKECETVLKVSTRWALDSDEVRNIDREQGWVDFKKARSSLLAAVVGRIQEQHKQGLPYTGHKMRGKIEDAIGKRVNRLGRAYADYKLKARNVGVTDNSIPSLKEIIESKSDGVMANLFPEFQSYAWADPKNRIAMDARLYLRRAQEEIRRVSLEFPRAVSYLENCCIFAISQLQYLPKKDQARARVIVKKAVDCYELCSSSFFKLIHEWTSDLDITCPTFTYNPEIRNAWRAGNWSSESNNQVEGMDEVEVEGDDPVDINIDDAVQNLDNDIGNLEIHTDIYDIDDGINSDNDEIDMH